MPSTIKVAHKDLTEIASKPDGSSLPLPSKFVSCSKMVIEEVIDNNEVLRSAIRDI